MSKTCKVSGRSFHHIAIEGHQGLHRNAKSSFTTTVMAKYPQDNIPGAFASHSRVGLDDSTNSKTRSSGTFDTWRTNIPVVLHSVECLATIFTTFRTGSVDSVMIGVDPKEIILGIFHNIGSRLL
jgi:hypothetical protein